ncbi:diphosphomevalonate decarboxylase [Leucobacter sp. UCMA 4100]|uniref:diphosphomevalonate decarboxylase n=1 Tax=Leucobacter sp. UCMA 4100 TaxID=2810534 RepID=UPI0022EB7BE5|nr:diphosphomevalonate decarboxylase [Leucobacter sp. UCMA 4100]MDA3148221.1 diphosphomevalonate decarboxylase [Leucobacter sp. UCMA 4100]
MSTAIAQPNIALIKYWGKVDEELILPATDSISLTLDGFPTTTTVELSDDELDTIVLNGRQLTEAETMRMRRVLDRARELSGDHRAASITSTNTIATAAGLASSAAGFAALATAVNNAYALGLDATGVSRLARLGSGSASRSVFGGMVRWHRGHDDLTSYAEPIDWNGPDLALVIVQLSAAQKAISSRVGMTRTIETSPFYEGWVTSNQRLVEQAMAAVAEGELAELGQLTELSTMRMHASMLGAVPPIRYLTGESFTVLDAVAELRNEGLTAYATADAGPNIKVLTTVAELDDVHAWLSERFPQATTLTSRLGAGAHLTEAAVA